MDTELTREVSAEDWRGLVAADSTATFFQTPDWASLLTSTIPGLSEAHIGVRSGGSLVGVLPVMRRRTGFITTLESMSFGTFGGPVVTPGTAGEVRAKLLLAFADMSTSAGVGHAQVVDRLSVMEKGALPGFRRVSETAQVVLLDVGTEELLNGFKPSARNKVRKARKAGVEIRRAVGEDDFMAYFSLLEECRRRWGSDRGPGRNFFLRLCSLDRDRVQMWLAVHEGRIIGGDLNFVTNGVVMNWGNVSSDAARSLAPSNLLHATAIEVAAADGHRLYDLGSSAGIEGVRSFKASFGAREVSYGRFVLDKGWYRALRKVAGR